MPVPGRVRAKNVPGLRYNPDSRCRPSETAVRKNITGDIAGVCGAVVRKPEQGRSIGRSRVTRERSTIGCFIADTRLFLQIHLGKVSILSKII